MALLRSLRTFPLFPVLSVALVVLTVGSAFGELSGRGALLGMVSACVITFVSALIGGSRYGISSPTGPMTAAVAMVLLMDQQWIQSQGSDLDPLLIYNFTILLAGVFLLVMALLGVHRLVKSVPQLVISGFMNGIAVLIFLSQVRVTQGASNWILLLVTFALSYAAGHFSERSSHFLLRLLLSSFGVIVLVSLAAQIFSLPVSFITLQETFAQFSFALPDASIVSFETMGILFPVAFELALMALLDTLLTAVIVDHKTRTKTHHTRELAGQSLTFAIFSLFGGLPGAQSTVPSMMMVQEKAGHPLAKWGVALICFLLTFLFLDFLEFVPTAVLGGVILKIGCDVADLTSFHTVFKRRNRTMLIQLFILLGVLISTVAISLNLAVIGFTMLFVLWNRSVPKHFLIPDLVPEKQAEGFADEL
ncbi:MAG: SulP family inorganic anion transporter [Candidatus Altimarinota bacterium]